MNLPALQSALGDRLAPLGGRLVYDCAYANHGMEGVDIAGLKMRAVLQMNSGSGLLHQVLLQPEGHQAPLNLLRKAYGSLVERWGAPTRACVTPCACGGPMTVELCQRFSTSVVHLTFLDFHISAMAFEDPNADRDPLTPYYKTRRNNPRFLPRKTVLRFHAAEGRELVTDSCP